MPYIDIDIDVDEYISSCSRRDIQELIKTLVEYDHLPSSVLDERGNVADPIKRGHGETEFIQKLEKISEKYYSLSSEEEEFFNKLFKKYL
jgi:hypothetical protein